MESPLTCTARFEPRKLSTSAWRITYEKAKRNRKVGKILGVRVPYLGLNDLIRSKRTGRPQDEADLQILLKR
ncbi:MAG TPA: hypothetical protein VI895_00385 [Bdellovibrionota bacterium]|nr:hypothetical protein [Bdellovibrionota bacterium]